MAQQTINVGTAPNDGTGTPLRTAFQYTNSNFTELYTAVGPSGNNIVVPGSATITGNLTVDTNTLFVDSANNRVGIVQATPLYPLHLVGEFGLEEASPAGTGSKLRFIGDATKYNFRIGKQLNVNNGFEITPSTTVGGTTFSNPVYTVTNDGIHTFLDGAGGTRMTLNSTGLGVGVSPSATIHAYGSGSSTAAVRLQAASGRVFDVGSTGSGYGAANNFIIYDVTGAAERLRIDSSGNVGIGVAPSAIGSTYRSLEFARGVSLFGQTDAASMELTCNAYIDSAFSWIYKTTAQASHYRQFQGTHQWHTAPSGTAGNAITFTERLRLKETGQLRFVPLASDPSGAEAGDVYYNSTSNKLKCYNGTTWNDLF